MRKAGKIDTGESPRLALRLQGTNPDFQMRNAIFVDTDSNRVVECHEDHITVSRDGGSVGTLNLTIMEMKCSVSRFDKGLPLWNVGDVRAVVSTTDILLSGDILHRIQELQGSPWESTLERARKCARAYLQKLI